VIGPSGRVDFSGEFTIRGNAGDRVEQVTGYLGVPESSSLILLGIGAMLATGVAARHRSQRLSDYQISN